LVCLGMAFAMGLYYAFLDSPLLFPIGIAETFFLFAYNLESFKGRFHNNTTFIISWGILPVFAGTAIQTSIISLQLLVLSGIAGALSYLLIKTSQKYKEFRRNSEDNLKIHRQEILLKIISVGVIAVTVSYFVLRYV